MCVPRNTSNILDLTPLNILDLTHFFLSSLEEETIGRMLLRLIKTLADARPLFIILHNRVRALHFASFLRAKNFASFHLVPTKPHSFFTFSCTAHLNDP